MDPPNNPAAQPAAHAPIQAAVPAINLAALSQSLGKIQLDNRIKLLKSNVRVFNGEGERRFQDWLSDMTRVVTVNAATDEEMRMLTMATLADVAADFVSRGIGVNPNLTWEEIKTKMIARYSDDADATVARQKLKKMEQKESETVQNFGERLFKQAKLAYPNVQIGGDPIVQSILIEILANGAKDYAIGRALTRKKPQTLDRALEIAAAEQALQRSCKMLKQFKDPQHEPMDVSAVQTERKENPETLAKLEVLIDAVSALANHAQQQNQNRYNNNNQQDQNRPYNNQQRNQNRPYNNQQQNQNRPNNASPQSPKQVGKNDDQGRPICFKCELAGHFARDCRGIPRNSNSNSTPLN